MFSLKSLVILVLVCLVVSHHTYVSADNNEGDDSDSNLYDGLNHFDDNEADADRSKCCLNTDAATGSASYCSANFNSNCLTQIQSVCGTQPSKECCKLQFRGFCRGQCEQQHQACKCDRNNLCLSAGTTCINGHCVCPPQETICGDDHVSNFGQCVFLNSTLNCGSCLVSCLPNSGEVCSNGECVCPSSSTLCNNVCTFTGSDSQHCGSCGTICSGGQFCQNGVCACAAGQTLCNGVCTPTDSFLSSLVDCGQCGNVCATPANAFPTCTSGVCGFTCDPDATLCNGVCESNLAFLTDPNNCGNCQNVCGGGQFCSGGSCSCPPGQTFCNGACTSTDSFLSDISNCGACDNVCPNGPPNSVVNCAAGSCGFICNAGYFGANCDQTVCSTNVGICQNGGTCNFDSSAPFYSCSCLPGSSGANCEITPCTSNDGICQNGGVCTYDSTNSNGYDCNCLTNFFGQNCGNLFTNITWTTHANQPNDNFYPNISANIGDQLNFYYTKPHTVYQFVNQAAYATCNLGAAFAVKVCGTPTTNTTTGVTSCNVPGQSPCVVPDGIHANCLITFTTLPVYFGCNVGNHCIAQAMHIKAVPN